MAKPTTQDLTARLHEAIRTRKKEDVWDYPEVYFLGENNLAKGVVSRSSAINQFGMGKYVFERGISVPEMYDVAKLERVFSPEGEDLSGNYILMERIMGCYLDELKNKDDFREASNKLREERMKVHSLGIAPCDSNNFGNSLFNTETRKLVVFDFGQWKVIDPWKQKEYEEFVGSLGVQE